jgi:hypothetical protein
MRGYRRAVEDIEAIVAKLKKKGMEIFSEIQNYENMYKLCYVRGPEGLFSSWRSRSNKLQSASFG